MSFRKEKKFRLTKSDLNLLKCQLLEKGMKILYPKRKINSCYFDTNNLKMYHESEEGILPRKKIRLRWYENNLKMNKEIKITSNEGRFKTIEKFKHNKNKPICCINLLDKNYGILIPTLIVNYEREYFHYKELRLTIDTNILYLDARGSSFRKIKDNENVLEIKTSINTSEDHIEKNIPLQSSRFSKYCRGIFALGNFE